MRTISYKRGSMLNQSIGCMVLAIGGAWAAFHSGFGPMLRFLGGFLAVCLPFLSVALFLKWRSDCVALRYDQQQLQISTLWRTTSVLWSDVRDISREKLTQSSGFGLFKQDIAHYLVITTATADGFEHSYRVQEELLDLPTGAVPGLMDELGGLWAARLEGARRSIAGASVPEPGMPSFDADAAVARYMAQRNTDAPVVPQTPARPAFGRKGLSS